MDEKEFSLEICRSMKCIILISHLQNKKLLNSTQNSSREFISLLSCICADRTVLPLVLIYENTSNDLQNIWFKDFDATKNQVYFAVSLKNWTNEELGLS